IAICPVQIAFARVGYNSDEYPTDSARFSASHTFYPEIRAVVKQEGQQTHHYREEKTAAADAQQRSSLLLVLWLTTFGKTSVRLQSQRCRGSGKIANYLLCPTLELKRFGYSLKDQN